GAVAAAQQPPGSTRGGSSTAGGFAPIRDTRERPITAGGVVGGGPNGFRNRAPGPGVGTFRQRYRAPDKGRNVGSPAGGVALIDFDNDGWLDVYLVNGGTRASLRGAEPPPRAALFRNNHDLTFTDVTDRAGVANERWGFGVAAGDVDNDGWMDLYVT